MSGFSICWEIKSEPDSFLVAQYLSRSYLTVVIVRPTHWVDAVLSNYMKHWLPIVVIHDWLVMQIDLIVFFCDIQLGRTVRGRNSPLSELNSWINSYVVFSGSQQARRIFMRRLTGSRLLSTLNDMSKILNLIFNSWNTLQYQTQPQFMNISLQIRHLS